MARERLRWTRTTGQRVVLVVNVVLVVALGCGALVVGYAAQKLAEVDRLEVAGNLTAASAERIVTARDIQVTPTSAVAAGQDAAATTTTAAPAPEIEENYLIVGSDNAERIAAGDAVLSGRDEEATNHLADTIMVLRLRPAEGTASLLSIPRDLEVTIAGTNRVAKINTAFNLPDAEARVARLIDTVEENLDIDLQHYVEVDLEGFRRVIDALGGVAVCFDGPARDRGSGLVVPAGWSELDGSQALAYVRSRKLEIQNLDGRWENASPRADLDRIERQQAFVRATVSQTFADVVSDPRLLLRLLDIASEELSVSNTLNVVGDGSDLAGWFRDFTEENLETLSLDVYDLPVTASRNNEFRLGMLASAEVQLDVFRGIDPDDVVPKRVEVVVVGDGSDAIAGDLVALGFEASRRSGAAVEATSIRYGAGGHDAANLVAAFIDGDVEFVVDEALSGLDLVLELGGDVSVRTTPRALTVAATPVEVAPEATTSTSEAPSTTDAQRFAFDCEQSTRP